MTEKIDLGKRIDSINHDIHVGASGDFEKFMEELDPLEWQYIISSRGDYLGCIITIESGGPHTAIDTYRREIRTTWGLEEASRDISESLAEKLNDFFREIFEGQLEYEKYYKKG